MESKELEEILRSHANWAHQWPTQKTGTYIYGNGKQSDTVSTKAAILAWHTAEVERAKAEAYDDAKRWLEDRLTSKKDVASICATRSAVLRGEIEAPKSRFAQPQPQKGQV